MSDGKKLISALLDAGSVETLRLVDRSLFEDNELVLFDFVSSHYRRYGELPALRTVEQETRTRLPAADEAVAYYTKRLFDRKLFVALREDFGILREALQSFNVDEARSIVDRMRASCRVTTPDNDLRTLREAAEDVLTKYTDSHHNPGMTGIPTGWPGLDASTGGYQKGDLISWVARMGVGKCMAPDTPVMRADGRIVRIDSLRPGMQLMGPDSTPRLVLSTTTGREEMFRVTPQHGEEWECNRSHILSLECANTIDKVHVQGQKYLYSVDQYLDLPKRVKTNLRLWRATVAFPAKDVPIEPYMVGLWLGDGTAGYARISTADTEIVGYLTGYAQRHGLQLSQNEHREGFCKQYALVNGPGRPNYLLEYLNSRCIWQGEKRIPEELLRNSRETRLAVLAGLVDSDGTLGNSGHYEILTKYEGLRDDILYLARTLGFGVTYAIKTVQGKEYHRISIRPTEQVPVLLPRKRNALVNRRSREDLSSFTVQSLGEGDYFGITLDKDSLYLLGDCTVTHNTYAMLLQAMAARRAGYSVLFITMEMTITQIVQRALALETGIAPDFIRKGTLSVHAERRLRRYVDTIAQADGMHFYSGAFTKKTADIEVVMSELTPDIVFVDGGYLAEPEGVPKNASRIDKVAGVFNDYKRMTITHDRPIVVSTQFSRQAGKRGKDGSLESISFSDAIAMNSSLVFGLKEGPPPYQSTRRIIETMKGREGESGQHQFNYRFNPIDFSEVHEDQVQAESVSVDWMG